LQEYEKRINESLNLQELEKIRIEIFGKKGILAQKFAELKNLAAEEKKEVAKNLNEIKNRLTKLLNEKKALLEKEEIKRRMKRESVDITLFDGKSERGALHPVNLIIDKSVDFFLSLGFKIEEGPLIENEFYNFEALNLPKHHPAREMQDTFFLKDGKLLRTQTSPVQIRVMEKQKPPIKLISPGPVFRRDYDLTHTPMFHQIEGLVVDQEGKVSFANLKYILENFLRHIFGDVKVRFRPSFFPFTEPSTEVDISCIFCEGKGCRVCKKTGWLEVLGAGMVDPNVFKAVGYENVSGYAFGMGVERLAMLFYAIPDLRTMFEGDLRLLEQFK